MRKIIVFLCLSMLSLWSISSEANGNILTIWPKHGKAIEVTFSEKPRVVYLGDFLRITTTKVQIDYQIKDLQKFTFDGINDENVIGNVRLNNNGSGIYVYDIGGKLVGKGVQDKSISTDDLKKGVYIIKQGNTTYKLLKR